MKILKFQEIMVVPDQQTGQQQIGILTRYVVAEHICSFVKIGIPSASGLTDARNQPMSAEGTMIFTAGGKIMVDAKVDEVEAMLTGKPAEVCVEEKIKTTDMSESRTIKINEKFRGSEGQGTGKRK